MEENPASENLLLIDGKSESREKYRFLKNLVRQRPYLSAILLAIYNILTLECIRSLVALIDLSPYKVPYLPGSIVAEALLIFLWVLVPVSILGWQRAPGFQRVWTWPLQIRGYRVLFLGLFLLLGLFPLLLLAFSKTIHQLPAPTIAMAAVFCLFVGIAEEGLFRGVILNVLLPKGIWQAVLLSSLLFGSVHSLNIFAGFPLNTAVAEMLSALGFGTFLAAVRLRTNSLRPGIIAHGFWDLPLILLYIHNRRILPIPLLQALLIGGIMCAIYIACTLIVLRPKKLRELRVMYGLAPAPPEPSAMQYERPEYNAEA